MHLSAALVLLLLGLAYSQAEDSLSKLEDSLESVDQPGEDLEEKDRAKKHALYGGYPFLPSVYPYGLPHQNLGLSGAALSSLIYPGLQGLLNFQGALPALQSWNLLQGSAPVFPYSTVITEQVQPVAPDVVVAQPGPVVEEVVESIVTPVTGINYVAPVLEEINQPALRPFRYPYYGAPDFLHFNTWRARHNEQLVLAGRPAVYTDVDVVAPVVGLPQYNYVL